jgi:DNA-binding transcriptional MocR family regulator
MSGNTQSNQARRTWKVTGTVVKLEAQKVYALMSMFNLPQAIPLSADSPRWLNRIGVGFSTVVYDEDIRKGSFSGTFAQPLKHEMLLNSTEAACLVSRRFSGQFDIDFTTGGLEGHEYLHTLLQRITKAIKADCLLGYQHKELEKKLKERITELWQLPPGEIVLTSSGSEALFLALSTQSHVAIQNPSFFGAHRTAKFLKLQTSHWSKIADIDPSATAAYFCPNSHPATGDTMTGAERTQLAANKQILIEDDPYFPLQFDKPQPHLFSLRNCPEDMYVGSFAKILGTGTRCGFIWTRSAEQAKKLRSVKTTVDLGHSALLWKIILLAATKNNLEAIINYNAGRKKLAEFIMQRPLPMTGGIFMVLPCFEGTQERAKQQGVTLDDLKHYYANGQAPAKFCRINLLKTSHSMLREGMQRIKTHLYP